LIFCKLPVRAMPVEESSSRVTDRNGTDPPDENRMGVPRDQVLDFAIDSNGGVLKQRRAGALLSPATSA
jgi:hypothetical protein